MTSLAPSSAVCGPSHDELVCGMCQHKGSDVKLLGCGCTLHARCVPLSLVILDNPMMNQKVPPPTQANTTSCPCCRSGLVSGMYLFPLSLELLDNAVALRKNCARAAAQASSSTATNPNGKRQRELDNDFHEVQAEASYFLLSHTRSSMTSSMTLDNDVHRTGRWTQEEIALVDFLLASFDRGVLTLPHGVKLNEFLGEVLLCKSSRLTKKMKNARLSARSYELQASSSLDCGVMSTLQHKFVQSVSSEPSQLELLFNITKLWRTHFSNLCLQVGNTMLDAADWVSSLEVMERRATEAEEMIRKARRRRMGLALKTDVKAPNPGVFFAGMPVAGRKESLGQLSMMGGQPQQQSALPPMIMSNDLEPNLNTNMFDDNNERNSVSGDDSSDADFFTHMLELSAQPGQNNRQRLMSSDFSVAFDDLIVPALADNQNACDNSNRNNNNSNNKIDSNMMMTPAGGRASPSKNHSCDHSPFLEEILGFLEANNLPFVHVDIWVPSLMPSGEDGAGSLRLFHAGYGTRNDIADGTIAQFNEFGEYSTRFSFAPGMGLPGRVYETGKPQWDTELDRADPKLFERAGGARIYGVKTVLGLPLHSSVGKIVVAMYTMSNYQKDDAVISKCFKALSHYAPEPKWRLVVDMGQGVNPNGSVSDGVGFPAGFEVGGAMAPPMQGSNSLGLLSSGAGLNTDASCASQGSQYEAKRAEDEQKIATLLGEYMPVSSGPTSCGESSSSSSIAPDLLPHFMQLRLLLLRSPLRRTNKQNDLLDVLLKSFYGYSKDNRRTGSELATLLVTDWSFLQASAAAGLPSPAEPVHFGDNSAAASGPGSRKSSVDSEQHQCHVMDAPMKTHSGGGMPTKRPSVLSYSNNTRNISLDSKNFEDMSAQRRISVASEVPDSPRSNINLVSEN